MAAWMLLGTAAPATAQVFSSEFFSDPISEGWSLIQQYCDPDTSNDGGWYHQRLDSKACPGGTQGGHDSYDRSLEPFNGMAQFFAEFRLQTDGDRSEIPAGAPAVVAMGHSGPVIFHVTVSRDLVKFARDLDLPILFIEIAPDVPHTYRIELYPDRYTFYIDAHLIDEGPPEAPFPSYNSLITWRGKSWQLPCHDVWDYIRYGALPLNGSGDYDSDGAATLDDFYFFHECLTNDRPGIHGGPERDSGPGCRFADFDSNGEGDGDTDLRDFAEFQNLFTSSP